MVTENTKIYNKNINKSLAQKFLLEKAQKVKYSKSTWEYLKKDDPHFFKEERKHLKLIATLFDMIDCREIWNLSFSLPRRYGKSYTTSKAIAIAIGRRPQGSIMRNAYGASKAEDYSRDTQAFIKTDFFRKIFPSIKLGKLTAMHKWSLVTSLEHAYTCAGVDGSLTGSGCSNLLVGDDLIRNMSEAMSAASMERLDKFKSAVHESSMEDGCAHLEIGTRWTRNDPQGEIEQNEKYIKFDMLKGDKLTDEGIDEFVKRIRDAIALGNFDPEFDWILVNIPALDLEGKSTCEGIRSSKWLKKRKDTLFRRGHDYIWDSMYQGAPFEAKGLLYPAESLNYFSLDDHEYLYGKTMIYIDYAGKGKDYHFAGVSKKVGGRVYMTDVLMTKKSSKFHFPKTVQLILKHHPDVVIFETNHGGDEYKNRIIDELARHGYRIPLVIAKFNTMNKEIRINLYSDLVIDNFYFLTEVDYPRDSDYALFINHLTNFKKEGGNLNDDPEDAISGLSEYVQKGGSSRVDVDSV